MDDLSDGVSKLQEFSSVLSSVTRGLDKNVRRLEDQFSKANSSLKEMKEAVNENKECPLRLGEIVQQAVIAGVPKLAHSAEDIRAGAVCTFPVAEFSTAECSRTTATKKTTTPCSNRRAPGSQSTRRSQSAQKRFAIAWRRCTAHKQYT